MKTIRIGQKTIGSGYPAYIIAEVGSNFDGDLKRAKQLARLSKDLGADAYKIQNFKAEKIVSNIGFKNLQVSFQATWDKPVVEVYRAAEFPRKWVKEIAEYCHEIGIDFLSAPYDTEAVDLLEEIGVPAYKIGSGEIDNLEFLSYIAKTGKPIILATGAATMKEIEAAVKVIKRAGNNQIVILQCVTNYPSPMVDTNLRAMVTLAEKFGFPVGFSDHTIGKEGGGDDPLHGITVPLASVALGGVVIEKHFTDDRTRKGPDHPFAMEPNDLSLMIKAIRALETALGDGKKQLMPSERETVVIQRRGAYATREIRKGELITKESVEFLRPAIGLRPHEFQEVKGKKARRIITKGEPIKIEDVVSR